MGGAGDRSGGSTLPAPCSQGWGLHALQQNPAPWPHSHAFPQCWARLAVRMGGQCELYSYPPRHFLGHLPRGPTQVLAAGLLSVFLATANHIPAATVQDTQDLCYKTLKPSAAGTRQHSELRTQRERCCRGEAASLKARWQVPSSLLRKSSCHNPM